MPVAIWVGLGTLLRSLSRYCLRISPHACILSDLRHSTDRGSVPVPERISAKIPADVAVHGYPRRSIRIRQMRIQL